MRVAAAGRRAGRWGFLVRHRPWSLGGWEGVERRGAWTFVARREVAAQSRRLWTVRYETV